MSRYAVFQAIQKLDPEKDHQRIVFLSSCYDFPFDTTRALEFALFRTFCVPSIAALLDRTGEFQKRPQKRGMTTLTSLSANSWSGDTIATGASARFGA